MEKFNSIILIGRRSSVESSNQSAQKHKDLDKNLLLKAINQYKSESKTILAISSGDYEYAREYLIFSWMKIIELKTPTRGALISLAMCLEAIDKDTPIIVAAGDSISKLDVKAFISKMDQGNYDAGLVAVKSHNPDYSYIRKIENSVIEVAEKKMISNLATTGIYYFRERELLVNSIEWVIANKLTTNDNYYLSTAINYLISTDAKIGIVEIKEVDYER